MSDIGNMGQTLPDMTPASAMIRTLGLISLICGLIIVAAYQGTYDAVQENKRIAVERAVFKVVPAAKSIVEYFARSDGNLEKVGAGGTASSAAPAGAIKFYAGYDASGKLAGIAAEGAAEVGVAVLGVLASQVHRDRARAGDGADGAGGFRAGGRAAGPGA